MMSSGARPTSAPERLAARGGGGSQVAAGSWSLPIPNSGGRGSRPGGFGEAPASSTTTPRMTSRHGHSSDGRWTSSAAARATASPSSSARSWSSIVASSLSQLPEAQTQVVVDRLSRSQYSMRDIVEQSQEADPIGFSQAAGAAVDANASERDRWSCRPVAALVHELDTNLEWGLSSEAVQRNRERYGDNKLELEAQQSILRLFVSQFYSPVVMLLLLASAVCLVTEKWIEAGAILFIVLINALLATFMERAAGAALAKLASMAAPNCRVIRDGGPPIVVPAASIVPGDIVKLETGDLVPGDIRLVQVSELQCNEALLTGESEDVLKTLEPSDQNEAFASNLCYAFTYVTAGSGLGIVYAIGMATQVGTIAAQLARESRRANRQTPLQKALNRLSSLIAMISLGVLVLVVVAAVVSGYTDPNQPKNRSRFLSIFLVAVGFCVSSIPEGLPMVVTICLALGCRDMARRKANVRRLPAVETLGCCTVICSDKTGTLTESKMTTSQLVLFVAQNGGDGNNSGGAVSPMVAPPITRVLPAADELTDQQQFGVTNRPGVASVTEKSYCGIQLAPLADSAARRPVPDLRVGSQRAAPDLPLDGPTADSIGFLVPSATESNPPSMLPPLPTLNGTMVGTGADIAQVMPFSEGPRAQALGTVVCSLWPTKGLDPTGGIFLDSKLGQTERQCILALCDTSKQDLKHDAHSRDGPPAKNVPYRRVNFDAILPDLGKHSDTSVHAQLVQSLTLAGFLNSSGSTRVIYNSDSKAWEAQGNASEAALLVAAAKGGWGCDLRDQPTVGVDSRARYPSLLELSVPFTSARKVNATVHACSEWWWANSPPAQRFKLFGSIVLGPHVTCVAVLKGAPEILAARSTLAVVDIGLAAGADGSSGATSSTNLVKLTGGAMGPQPDPCYDSGAPGSVHHQGPGPLPSVEPLEMGTNARNYFSNCISTGDSNRETPEVAAATSSASVPNKAPSSASGGAPHSEIARGGVQDASGVTPYPVAFRLRLRPLASDTNAAAVFPRANESLALQGLRVIGAAICPLNENQVAELRRAADADARLTYLLNNCPMALLGLFGSLDPPRPGVSEAIQECTAAGIKVVMITGDHRLTATSIAEKIGILNSSPIEESHPSPRKRANYGTNIDVECQEDTSQTGCGIAQAGTLYSIPRVGNDLRPDVIVCAQLHERGESERPLLPEEFLDPLIQNTRIFCRAQPEDKIAIVRSLQRQGEIVAMTGDGVNDAAALKAAHIGIAMGITGTEVAKSAADMILVDDNFCTIVAAVEEGRKIYGNIQKFVSFLLGTNIGEIVYLTTAILVGFKMPVEALQILFLNLMSDGCPAVALTREPADRDCMKKPPRHPKSHIMTRDWWLYSNAPHTVFQAICVLACLAAATYLSTGVVFLAAINKQCYWFEEILYYCQTAEWVPNGPAGAQFYTNIDYYNPLEKRFVQHLHAIPGNYYPQQLVPVDFSHLNITTCGDQQLWCVPEDMKAPLDGHVFVNSRGSRQATTVVFMTAVFCEMFRAYTVRAWDFFLVVFQRNKWMHIACFISASSTLLLTLVPALQQMFGLWSIAWWQYCIAVGFAVSSLVLDEAIPKPIYRRLLQARRRKELLRRELAYSQDPANVCTPLAKTK